MSLQKITQKNGLLLFIVLGFSTITIAEKNGDYAAKKYGRFIRYLFLRNEDYQDAIDHAVTKAIKDREDRSLKACRWSKVHSSSLFSRLMFIFGSNPQDSERERWVADRSVREASKQEKGLGRGMFSDKEYADWQKNNAQLVTGLRQASQTTSYKDVRRAQLKICEAVNQAQELNRLRTEVATLRRA